MFRALDEMLTKGITERSLADLSSRKPDELLKDLKNYTFKQSSGNSSLICRVLTEAEM